MTWHWVYSASILAVSFAAIACSFIIRNELARGLLISGSIVFAMLAAADLYFRAGDEPMLKTDSHSPGYHGSDAVLGKRTPPPGAYNVTSHLKETGKVIYDVTYTIGADGFRETEGAPPGAETVVFFGGSFTYGDGVEDQETFPAQFSRALDHRYHIINTGFGGYGPHQMLRLLETGRVEKATKGPVVAAYYLMIQDHLKRAVGLHRWNLKSPRYFFDNQGTLQPGGLYSDTFIASFLAELEAQRGLAGRLERILSDILMPRKTRIDLAAAIIVRSAELIRQKYGIELYCLIFDTHWQPSDLSMLERKLRDGGVKFLRVSDFVPDLSPSSIHILPGIEHHPNAAFDAQFGKALAEFQRSLIK